MHSVFLSNGRRLHTFENIYRSDVEANLRYYSRYGTTVHMKGSPSISDGSHIPVLRIHEILELHIFILIFEFFLKFLLVTFDFWGTGTFTSFFKDKRVIQKSQNIRNQCFSYYFCLMIEGTGSGSVSLTNRSGYGRSKNIWILRIRIRNTAKYGIKRYMHSMVTACSRQGTRTRVSYSTRVTPIKVGPEWRQHSDYHVLGNIITQTHKKIR